MVGREWCSQVRASSELQFGVLRQCGCTREAGSTVVADLSGGYAADLAKAQGSTIVDEPEKG